MHSSADAAPRTTPARRSPPAAPAARAAAAAAAAAACARCPADASKRAAASSALLTPLTVPPPSSLAHPKGASAALSAPACRGGCAINCSANSNAASSAAPCSSAVGSRVCRCGCGSGCGRCGILGDSGAGASTNAARARRMLCRGCLSNSSSNSRTTPANNGREGDGSEPAAARVRRRHSRTPSLRGSDAAYISRGWTPLMPPTHRASTAQSAARWTALSPAGSDEEDTLVTPQCCARCVRTI
eukprot:363442-Chlamydomonas_euryale.AAC.7